MTKEQIEAALDAGVDKLVARYSAEWKAARKKKARDIATFLEALPDEPSHDEMNAGFYCGYLADEKDMVTQVIKAHRVAVLKVLRETEE